MFKDVNEYFKTFLMRSFEVADILYWKVGSYNERSQKVTEPQSGEAAGFQITCTVCPKRFSPFKLLYLFSDD